MADAPPAICYLVGESGISFDCGEKMKLVKLKKSPYYEIFFLTIISAVVYLPYASSMTYYRDDWYYIYDGVVAGPNIFHSMFSIDRPARGYFFDVYFSFFGPIPLPYHLGAYVWRLVAGLCALWLFRILWPENRKIVFFGALLFILYPGYSWWVNAIEYQPMVASLALQVFSFVTTLEVIRTPRYILKMLFAGSAILSGWAYLALVEYAIGMEFFRFLCVYILVSRGGQDYPGTRKVLVSLKTWGWNAFIPIGFMIWRLFIFENQRKTTDINLLISKFQDAPADTLLWWAGNIIKSLTNAGVHAWYQPFQSHLVDSGIQTSYIEEIILAMGIFALASIPMLQWNDSMPVKHGKVWKKISVEALFLGLSSLVVGILPVIIANRYVNLTFYSHYSLPASLAAATLLIGFVSYLISARYLWNLTISIFVVIAGVTHSLLAQKTIAVESFLENFWWQASWRIPDLRPDTTLVTLYPNSSVVDYGVGLDELPSLIYFPETQYQLPIRFPVSTLLPIDSEVALILASSPRKSDQYRVHKKITHYDNILILVQPTPLSCVRVVGGENIVLSDDDPENIKKISTLSKIENIRLQIPSHTPPKFAFGPEPEHGWCYLFENADLAVQRRDWDLAARFGDEALALGLYPADQVEWFPFIQAYAMMGNKEKLEIIAMETAGNVSFKNKVCVVFQTPTSTLGPDLEIEMLLERLFCE